METMINMMRNNKGFIAALDQSGGSSAKTLSLYGIGEDKYNSEEEMFSLIHEMRKRVITSKSFTNKHIIATILFERTMNSKIEDKYTADYLWENKKILSFLKVDKGLAEINHGVKLMKDIPSLEETLEKAKEKHIFGTKMRSVIYEANEEGIKEVVKQQFEFAKIICKFGLVPIIEPEVDINSKDKILCEEILKKEIINELSNWDKNNLIMFKFTIPTIPNFYYDLYDYECVLKLVALSGGYSCDFACSILALNNRMIASFSRALLEKLNVNQSEEEFDKVLEETIEKIYVASST